MLQPGTILDNRYRILSVLGRGGTSCVYLAENIRIKKTWAIKEVYKHGMDQSITVQNGLIAESAILTKIRHACLPDIIDVIDAARSYYIVMEYIEGRPLNKVLEQNGAQPENTVLKWAKQLCDVLIYLHTQQPAIIYRDMKPANIMLKPDGHITLVDFGTAREFKSARARDTVHLGTRGYAAPEQYSGAGQSDARTDIYCLGVTIYHLVTGQDPCLPPYGLRPIRQINPALSTKMERIIQKCTQLNPDDRYQSAAELMNDLDDTRRAGEDLLDDDSEPRKPRGMLLLAALVPAFIVVLGIVMAVVLSSSPGNGLPINDPASIPPTYGGTDADPFYGGADVWIKDGGEHMVYRFVPPDSGVYHFYSVSGNEVPIIWLSDEEDNTLCDSNTYGTNDDFDFSYRLDANQTYYLEIALYTFDDNLPKTGYFQVYVEFKDD